MPNVALICELVPKAAFLPTSTGAREKLLLLRFHRNVLAENHDRFVAELRLLELLFGRTDSACARLAVARTEEEQVDVRSGDFAQQGTLGTLRPGARDLSHHGPHAHVLDGFTCRLPHGLKTADHGADEDGFAYAINLTSVDARTGRLRADDARRDPVPRRKETSGSGTASGACPSADSGREPASPCRRAAEVACQPAA
jgi:hypothetical protein